MNEAAQTVYPPQKPHIKLNIKNIIIINQINAVQD